MIDILMMTQGHQYWNETMEFANECSWGAGPYLASKMR